MKNLYLTGRFFSLFAAIALVFVVGFVWTLLFPVAKLLLLLCVAVVIADGFLLFRPSVRVTAERKLPKLFSLGDPNEVRLSVRNFSEKAWHLTLIDELPKQFQKRDFEMKISLKPLEERQLVYELKPVQRGAFRFGNINIYVKSHFGLMERRITVEIPMEVPVYPSVIQMKKFELKAFQRVTTKEGIRRVRRLGHSYEFDQIKNYIRGDDIRSINWKATGRHHDLMVNQYDDERSQQVYCLIDKSRVMKMPFEGLSLLDYAINSSLVISNIVLRKHDKAGLLTFSDVIGSVIKADRKGGQLNRILHALYNEKEHLLEANYELLYHGIRRLISHRSLLLLFTNFESMYALDRVLPILRRINKLHLVVVIFFENTEIRNFAMGEAQSLEGIYTQTVAQKFIMEKEQMVQKLRQFGIQSILTRPEDLSVNTINKYLELKARGLI